MNVIEVENLVKKYKKASSNAVDNISFNVAEGEFFAFLGPNGAGKTTTISILTTTLSKTSGNVKIAGFDIDAEQDKVRSKIGVIFQNPSLDLNLTAEENIRFHAILYKLYKFTPTYGMMPKEYKNTVMSLAEVLGLKDDIFKPIRTFSGGMKRKLEIMRTLIHKPKVLFLDEPTSGLDPLSRKNLWEYLKGIKQKENTTIFLTTHYLEEAEDADTVCVINHGKIIINDSLQSIKNNLVKNHIYVESDSGDTLKSELDKLGYKFELSGKGFNIYTNGNSLQHILKSINTELKNIKVFQPTLDAVYVDLVREKDE